MPRLHCPSCGIPTIEDRDTFGLTEDEYTCDRCLGEDAMPQTRHTPGPWVVSDNSMIEDKRGLIVACAYDLRHDKEGHEQEANARLIASAPEMLAMLQDVSAWLETHLQRGTINAGTANRDGDLVSQIRATIHHATGRQAEKE